MQLTQLKKQSHKKILSHETGKINFLPHILSLSTINKAGDILFWQKEIDIDFAYKRGLYGKDITIVIMDTGIYPHKDFITPNNRILCFRDFVSSKPSPYDDSGHGTHVAGIIGSNGKYKDYYIGAAPKCNLIILKVLDEKGNGTISGFFRGIDWILAHKKEYDIRIVNISIGTRPTNQTKEESSFIQKVNSLWDAGIIVVAAAGNDGPKSKSITTPGISRKVITVGAIESNHRKISSNYSGNGPTDACIIKPELVAPGTNILSCAPSLSGYFTKSGTSMSTPIISGCIALLLESEPDLTPKEVKLRLYHSTKDLKLDKSKQGWGMIQVNKLIS